MARSHAGFPLSLVLFGGLASLAGAARPETCQASSGGSTAASLATDAQGSDTTYQQERCCCPIGQDHYMLSYKAMCFWNRDDGTSRLMMFLRREPKSVRRADLEIKFDDLVNMKLDSENKGESYPDKHDLESVSWPMQGASTLTSELYPDIDHPFDAEVVEISSLSHTTFDEEGTILKWLRQQARDRASLFSKFRQDGYSALTWYFPNTNTLPDFHFQNEDDLCVELACKDLGKEHCGDREEFIEQHMVRLIEPGPLRSSAQHISPSVCLTAHDSAPWKFGGFGQEDKPATLRAQIDMWTCPKRHGLKDCSFGTNSCDFNRWRYAGPYGLKAGGVSGDEYKCTVTDDMKTLREIARTTTKGKVQQ